ncbi:Gr22 [Eciton burchellii]|nr:Gr22 [Eciton burchellii]
MVRTIQTALSLLLTIGSICGLAIFEYPLGRSRPRLSCLYFLITWSLYVFTFYYLSCNMKIISWPIAAIMLATIISMFDSLFHFKEMKMCLHKLSIVDDTLEVLGKPKEYRLLHKRTIRLIIGWITLACFLNTCDSLWMYQEYFYITRICFPIFINYLIYVNIYNGLMCGIILGYVGSKFQQVNELIYELLEDDTKCIDIWNKIIPIDQRKIEIKDCKKYMWIVMHVHLHLSHISRQLNKMFSIQMTLQMASYFALSVDMLCLIYTLYIYKNKTFQNIMDQLIPSMIFVIIFVKLCKFNQICQIVSDKAHETTTILFKLFNGNPDEDLRKQILQFILQIKQQNVKFSGMGLFYFGYDFIHKFCKSVMTVLVIIIQMKVFYEVI